MCSSPCNSYCIRCSPVTSIIGFRHPPLSALSGTRAVYDTAFVCWFVRLCYILYHLVHTTRTSSTFRNLYPGSHKYVARSQQHTQRMPSNSRLVWCNDATGTVYYCTRVYSARCVPQVGMHERRNALETRLLRMDLADCLQLQVQAAVPSGLACGASNSTHVHRR